MDEGTAALIAGLAGTAGAIAGAVVGAVAAVRGARIGAEKAAETARLQVQDQASIDHEHWLRQQRIEAYSEFLTVYDDSTVVAGRTRKKIVEMEPAAGQPEEDLRELKEIVHRLRQVRQRVKLVGPETIHTRATALEDSVQDYYIDLEVVAEAKASGDPDAPQMFEQEYAGMRASANAHDSFVRAIGALIEGREAS
ncbi:hypothetical protein [Streptomyces europaeiscabiei]|uniref:hypothetical protein n=1 Tax=Streptomyces europaeiscabiei TaxID=146819 RepID=UPI002E26ABD2|nr:hypothetical protein OG858_25705 [Streptomyces europaeiscabiei]